MHAGQDDVLGNLVEAEPDVDAGRGPLDGVDDAALERRIDLAARQDDGGGAEVLATSAQAPEVRSLRPFRSSSVRIGFLECMWISSEWEPQGMPTTPNFSMRHCRHSSMPPPA